MKTKTATAISVLVILALFAIWAVSLMRVTHLLDQEAQALMTAGESIRVAQELKSRLLVHNRNAFLYSLTSDASRAEDRPLELSEMSKLLNAMSHLVGSPEEAAVFEDLRDKITTYQQRRHELDRSPGSPTRKYNQISKLVDDTLIVADRLIEINRAEMTELSDSVNALNAKSTRLGLFLLVLGALVLLMFFVFTVTFISRPLDRLSEVISAYGMGDSKRRAKSRGLREIRQISATFNSMAGRLEDKRREQLRFIASVAHDIRNPLNAMAMAANLLTHHGAQEERELAGVLVRQVRNLDRMVEDLLDATRIEAGQLQLQCSRHDLALLIKDCAELHGTSASHSLRLELPSAPLVCECDGRRISQVINNLLSNALKYSPNGGLVTVKARLREGTVTVSVRDEGIGIAPQDLEQIFIPFRRTEHTREMIPGIGLGLSSSRRIIEAHGGNLTVESVQGRGSTFYFSLPAGRHMQAWDRAVATSGAA